MPSLSERWCLLLELLVRVELDDVEEDAEDDGGFMALALLVGMTVVLSCRSEDSSDTKDTDPVEEAAEELESTEQTPVVEDAAEEDDSMVEFISGRPISWKEFIELNPLSSSAELEIIISLIRSMFAL